jgi:hypothetical protein
MHESLSSGLFPSVAKQWMEHLSIIFKKQQEMKIIKKQLNSSSENNIKY